MLKVVNGVTVEVSKEERQAIEDEWVANEMADQKIRYRALRQGEYPPIGDQLDALMKQFQFTNIPVSPEYQLIIDQCMAVKKKYPKP